MSVPPAIEVEGLTHSYDRRPALQGVSFTVLAGETFGVLGPNGGGKTTLFRILTTLLPPASGRARVLGEDVTKNPQAVRQAIGVVFQSASLDGKLTVRENLRHQGHLYGLSGKTLGQRIALMLERLGLTDRRNDPVEKLSGGLRRRVEIAKGLLHSPQLLLLDEPSTGLDVGARRDLRRYLRQLSQEEGTTILLTTHLMEEADACDRLVILDRGALVALGSPEALKKQIGGDVIVLESAAPGDLGTLIRQRFGGEPTVVNGTVRLERENGHRFLTELVEAFPGQIDAVTVAKPTLEDVFIRQTGHRFWEENQVESTE